MIGLSGSYADAKSGLLSLDDMAVGLSRIPRFGGQTILTWSVADHLLACMKYAEHASPRRRLLVGLHDAHESMTSDIPTSFKTKDMKFLQRALDDRLYAALGIAGPTATERHYIIAVDRDMLLADASLVAPPATYEKIVEEHTGRRARFDAKAAVGWVLQQQWGAAETAAAWLHQIREALCLTTV